MKNLLLIIPFAISLAGVRWYAKEDAKMRARDARNRALGAKICADLDARHDEVRSCR